MLKVKEYLVQKQNNQFQVLNSVLDEIVSVCRISDGVKFMLKVIIKTDRSSFKAGRSSFAFGFETYNCNIIKFHDDLKTVTLRIRYKTDKGFSNNYDYDIEINQLETNIELLTF